MTSLVEIIAGMLNSRTRAACELPRGLWFVYYPPDDHAFHQFIAGRRLAAPSQTELDVVREALLEALDRHESRVVVDLTKWNETTKGHWHGYVVTWRFATATDAFSADPDRARLVHQALERRDERIKERRRKAQRQRGRGAGRETRRQG